VTKFVKKDRPEVNFNDTLDSMTTIFLQGPHILVMM